MLNTARPSDALVAPTATAPRAEPPALGRQHVRAACAGPLKALLPALSSKDAAACVAEDALAVLHLGDPLLTQHSLDALAALLGAEAAALLPSAGVSAVLDALDEIH